MYDNLNVIKGLHPGFFVERELAKSGLKKKDLAQTLDEHPQTIGAILKAKRRMNISLSLKLEQVFGLEEGFLMILQVYYDIEQKKNSVIHKPDIEKLRPILFWDTDIQSINWEKQKRSVIQRVFERGNEVEKEEIRKFYGEAELAKVIDTNE